MHHAKLSTNVNSPLESKALFLGCSGTLTASSGTGLMQCDLMH